MKVLLVGSGGREHALAWKIAKSSLLTRLVSAPGNPGMAALGEVRPVKATDVARLVALAQEIEADLVVIGPDAAIEAGLADALEAAGIPAFGPTKAAGRLESSKAFTKDFCARHNLPTAAYGVFEEAAKAKAFLDRFSAPYVIKADGLALGKGVIIAADRAEAEAAIDEMLGGKFGSAGARLVVEEFMQGEEVSLFALCDGTRAVAFGAAQDHKRIFDGDEGPNTGGMGSYSPAPVFTDELAARAMRELVEPTVAGMAAEGNPYKGVLFAGLMLTPDGPKLVEYNARLGDPETQVLMLRLESDILPLLLACATGTLDRAPAPVWSDQAAICVVLASQNYPDTPRTGDVIEGAEADFGHEVEIFQAGTARDAKGALVSAGGRVLNICALAPELSEARNLAYATLGAISLRGGQFRADIGWRALKVNG